MVKCQEGTLYVTKYSLWFWLDGILYPLWSFSSVTMVAAKEICRSGCLMDYDKLAPCVAADCTAVWRGAVWCVEFSLYWVQCRARLPWGLLWMVILSWAVVDWFGFPALHFRSHFKMRNPEPKGAHDCALQVHPFQLKFRGRLSWLETAVFPSDICAFYFFITLI